MNMPCGMRYKTLSDRSEPFLNPSLGTSPPAPADYLASVSCEYASGDSRIVCAAPSVSSGVSWTRLELSFIFIL